MTIGPTLPCLHDNGAANYCDGVIVGIAYLRGDVFRFLAARAAHFGACFNQPRCRIARVQCSTMDSWTNLVRSPAEQMAASQSFYRQRGWVEVNMNRRDQELLDRQMRRFQPSPHPVGLMMLILAGAFLVGMIAGSIVFTNQQPMQTASIDGKTALAFLLSGTRSEPR